MYILKIIKWWKNVELSDNISVKKTFQKMVLAGKS